VAAAKRAFNWAAQQGYIEHNPLRYVEKPAANIRQEVVSDSEHKTILALIPDPQFRDVVEFARNTGVRPMEVTRLEERHLELKRKRIVFPEAESKGKKKKRVIYLNREALEIVKRNRRDGHIFRNTRGKPWTAFAMNCRFEKMKTKLGKRYNMYMYRHTFATRKLQQGVDPITVAILLGHADVSTLAKVYQHLQNDAAHLLKAANV
jgi:integrase